MKTVLFATLLIISSTASAWYGPGGFYPWVGGYGMGYGYGGFPPGAYGAMGYGWGVQAPSFNYNTVIQQSPPVIINNNDPNYAPQGGYRQPQQQYYNGR